VCYFSVALSLPAPVTPQDVTISTSKGGIRLDNRDTEALYRRYGPMILRRCRQMLKDEDAALDTLQDVFARWLQLGRELPEYPSSFFYTMATRLCIDRIRSAAARPQGETGLLEQIASAGDLENESGARRILDRIFGRQEESTRVMAVLHYVDGLTHEEVAAEVNMSAAGVRRRLQRLRERAAAWGRSTGALPVNAPRPSAGKEMP
jgi:RNA polymerase sigma-70 factor (ECF subfamily)